MIIGNIKTKATRLSWQVRYILLSQSRKNVDVPSVSEKERNLLLYWLSIFRSFLSCNSDRLYVDTFNAIKKDESYWFIQK